MTRHLIRSGGLIGRIFAVLLLTILIEFGVSTVLYERASQFAVRDDEARRLAEHLVIARKLLAEQPPPGRVRLAEELTTTRYEIRWGAQEPPPRVVAPTLDRIYDQVIRWEPGLATTSLRLRLTSPGPGAVIAGALRLPDGSWLHFRTREPLHQLDLGLERILLALTPAMGLILIGGLLVRQMLMPMRRLAEAVERMGKQGGDAVELVPEAGPGELRRVIRAFNAMQARIHRLIEDRTQALAAVGHDLRTPLARLRLRADGIDQPGLHEAIRVDLTEMEAMIESLLAYLGGEGEAEAPSRVDVAVLCATVADDAADRGHDVAYDGPDHLELIVRPVGLKRAVVNLVENAIHHADRVWIRTAATDAAVTIAVEDDGPGIPEAALARVLEPFVRLDRARTRDTVGFGLGLAIVSRVMEAEGGTVTLENRAEGGLRARLTLPRRVLPHSNNS